MTNKFTYGDSVLVTESAPAQFHPGEYASVCGFVDIDSEEAAKEFLSTVGDWVYIIEFSDGSDIQIAERYLKKYELTDTILS